MRLHGFRRILPDDIPALDEANRETTGPARFWRAPSFLAGDSANLIGTYEGCLCVLRRKQLHGHHILYLSVPPYGPRDAAAHVLRVFTAAGIGAKLTVHDAQLYGLDIRPQKGNVEYAYRAEPAAEPHVQWLALDRRLAEGKVELVRGSRLGPYVKPAVALAKLVYRQRHGLAGVHRTIQAFAAAPERGDRWVHAVFRSDTHQMIALSLTERVGPGEAAATVRIRDHDTMLAFGALGMLHYLDAQQWAGFDVTAGAVLPEFGPARPVQICEAVLPRRLTAEEYAGIFAGA